MAPSHIHILSSVFLISNLVYSIFLWQAYYLSEVHGVDLCAGIPAVDLLHTYKMMAFRWKSYSKYNTLIVKG